MTENDSYLTPRPRPCVGSLCTGYGGLELGLMRALDIDVAWHAENDPHAARVLAARWPGAPNLGDITAVDWSAVEPVDIVCAGFPCQDLSYAGRGAGIVKGNRSGLWYAVADAIGVLRPRMVVLENVAAIVSRRPGLDVVLTSLAAIGFDADWLCLRAADAGACHGRDRWFCVATDARSGSFSRPGAARDGFSVPAECGAISLADADLGGPQGVGRVIDIGRDAHGRGGSDVAWGDYEPAIRRWEQIIGRPAPRPTEPGRAGERLSPRFVEWMQGLADGWVTDVLPRNPALKALGNGVVPQQAALALRTLLPLAGAVAA